MILNIRELIDGQHNKGFVRRGKKINDISNDSSTLEEAKAKVQSIIESGAMKRKKVKRRKSKSRDE